MSITSSNHQSINSDFSELLASHPGLATWISNTLQNEAGMQAEELLPAFLAECASQNISSADYPFTASDRGLGDLRLYLAFASSTILDKQAETHLSSTLSAIQANSEDSDESDRARNSVPTDRDKEAHQTPVARTTPGEKDNRYQQKALPSTAQKENPQENAEIAANEETLDLAERATQPVASVPGGVQPGSGYNAQPASTLEASEKPLTEQEVDTAETISEEATEQLPIDANTGLEVPAETGSISANNELTEDKQVAAQDEDKQPAIKNEQTKPPAENGVSANEPIATINESKQSENEAVRPPVGEADKATVPLQKAPPGPFRSMNPFKWQRKRKKPAQQQNKRQRRPRSKRQRIIAWSLVVLILGAIIIPAGFLINFGVKAYTVYQDLSGEAHSAVSHLLNVKKIFTGDSSHLNGLLDTTKLQKAQQEFLASGHDFQQLQDQLKHSDTINTIVTYFPSYRTTLKSAQLASAIGIDVAKIGQIGIESAIELIPSLNGPLLAHSEKPLITQSMLDTIGTTIDQITPLLRDIQANASGLSLSSLPISAQEKAQIEPLLSQLPQVINDLGLVRNLLGTSGWLLGVSQPRTFLVQTMDRAELRGSGGFTGQYGEMTISGGRVAPFALKDISLIEYVDGSANQGKLAPKQYQSWWPFANWGLRDSNISADFPTTAQQAIDLYKQEVGRSVDGVISFTPIVIEHVLNIIGPISVPGYNITVTSQNLEDVLHFYQLDNSGIYKQKSQQPDDATTSARKRFTNNLASLFMDKLRAASPVELLAIAHQVLYDLKAKDLQMYFTDPTAEHILMQYGYAAQIDRATTHDGFYVVQQNLSASKASQYVATTINDTITLDSKGGATHLLQLRMIYNQAGPVYGYDTYYDYLRVYVPTNSKLLWGQGFSTGTPLCGGSYGSCPADNVFPNGELVCPSGQYQPGTSPPSLSGSDGATFEPLQTLGGPTNTSSDEPGRAMYGGWAIIPKNCTLNVTLSWYVPPLSKQPYSVLVQRQAGTFSDLDLTILPSNCVQQSTTGLHFSGILTEDRSFTVPTYDSRQKGTQSCYPQSGT